MAQPSTPARDSSCATPDIAALLLAWPLFQLMVTSPTAPVMALVIAMLGVILAFSFGPLPPLLSSTFPAAIGGTGLAVTFNVGVTLLHGIAPLVLTWLLTVTGSLNAPSLFFVRTRYKQR